MDRLCSCVLLSLYAKPTVDTKHRSRSIVTADQELDGTSYITWHSQLLHREYRVDALLGVFPAEVNRSLEDGCLDSSWGNRVYSDSA